MRSKMNKKNGGVMDSYQSFDKIDEGIDFSQRSEFGQSGTTANRFKYSLGNSKAQIYHMNKRISRTHKPCNFMITQTLPRDQKLFTENTATKNCEFLAIQTPQDSNKRPISQGFEMTTFCQLEDSKTKPIDYSQPNTGNQKIPVFPILDPIQSTSNLMFASVSSLDESLPPPPPPLLTDLIRDSDGLKIQGHDLNYELYSRQLDQMALESSNIPTDQKFQHISLQGKNDNLPRNPNYLCSNSSVTSKFLTKANTLGTREKHHNTCSSGHITPSSSKFVLRNAPYCQEMVPLMNSGSDSSNNRSNTHLNHPNSGYRYSQGEFIFSNTHPTGTNSENECVSPETPTFNTFQSNHTCQTQPDHQNPSDSLENVPLMISRQCSSSSSRNKDSHLPSQKKEKSRRCCCISTENPCWYFFMPLCNFILISSNFVLHIRDTEQFILKIYGVCIAIYVFIEFSLMIWTFIQMCQRKRKMRYNRVGEWIKLISRILFSAIFITTSILLKDDREILRIFTEFIESIMYG